ncbi:MAG: hypothetical protein ACXACI_13725 [Candidatus Hodarchaeales archaeon]|jgi:hypothetical protein
MESITAVPNELEKAIVSFQLALKSVFFGRKWIIFLVLGLFPLTFTLLVEDRLLGNPDARAAFVDLFIGFQYLLFFTFSCLILSLPMSADEISDHVIDLYLVRPIRREVLWGARWLAANVSVLLLNFSIAIIYYLYFHVVEEDFSGIINDLDLLSSAFIFLVAATLAYAGIFLFVGFIGNRGFTFGVTLAIFELFLLSLLFLADEPYIPRTNLQVIADDLFGNLYNYTPKGTEDLLYSWGFVGLLAVVFFVVGAAYLRIREFN